MEEDEFQSIDEVLLEVEESSEKDQFAHHIKRWF